MPKTGLFVACCWLLLVSGSFRPGWNYLVWQSEWGSERRFTELPRSCPTVVVKQNGWFYSFVRGYAPDRRFTFGQEYFVFCHEGAYWQIW